MITNNVATRLQAMWQYDYQQRGNMITSKMITW